jgi:8-oxo-dGTP diphosphatase
VRILLVRHGHAGTKEGWDGDDRLRSLDTRGRRQANHLVGIIVPLQPTRLISSPYTRCLQTMDLIAEKTGLVVEEDEALTPNAGQQAVQLVRTLSHAESNSATVLCTHGEVIGDVLTVIASEEGVRLSRRPPGLKGCVWVLDIRKGRVVTARYITPGR